MEVLKEYYKLKNDTLVMVQNEYRTLQSELRSVKINLGTTKDRLESTNSKLAVLESRHSNLTSKYEQLESNSQKLASSSQAESSQLKAQLKKANTENEHMKRLLTNMDKAYQVHLTGAIMANETWEQRLSRMNDISQTIDAERSQLANLYELMASLPLFGEEGFEVVNGRQGLTVRLPSDIVFRTGSSNLNTKGRKTIEEITGVILRNSNLNVHVVGHTDDTGKDSANWSLSTSRAASVAKHMISAEFMPTRLFATGRSSHEPINIEESSKAKKSNRRIEIIVKPRTIR